MLPCMQTGPAPDLCCDVTRARLVERLNEISERRRQLQATESALAAWLGGDAVTPPIRGHQQDNEGEG